MASLVLSVFFLATSVLAVLRVLAVATSSGMVRMVVSCDAWLHHCAAKVVIGARLRIQAKTFDCIAEKGELMVMSHIRSTL